MSGMEITLKKKIRNSKIQKIVLTSLYAAGVLGAAMVMPNMLSLLKKLDPNRKNKTDPKYVITDAIKRLESRGLLVWEKTKAGTFLRLTKDGEKTIQLIERNDYKIAKPKKWDGKWRVIIFDIHETKRVSRNKFRLTLQEIGFLKLQNSVWVYPYNCEELITLIKADFMVGKEILYIIADSIENDKWVKKHFNLL